MKIAITADVHLTSRERNPERYHALENILQQLVSLEIDHLIIAGDLFDSSCKNPAEFESLFQNDQFSKITVYIIPGNHDPMITDGMFTSKNIHCITKPKLMELAEKEKFLFIPYKSHASIGPVIMEGQYLLETDKWVLIGHGDWLATNTPKNNYENDQYMPLSRGDLHMLKPKKVFLGHIHAPYDSDMVLYPGSPCPLNPTETGIRTFLLYDSTANLVERYKIENDKIFMEIKITIVPIENEGDLIHSLLDNHISSWRMPTELMQKVTTRVIVQGYSSNREVVQSTIEKAFQSKNLLLESRPDVTGLKLSGDLMRADIAIAVKQLILDLNLENESDEPTTDDYVMEALNIIYKG